jgi:hypothetical protein
MPLNFGVTRVVVEFVADGKTYEIAFEGQNLPKSLYFDPEEELLAYKALGTNLLHMHRFPDFLETGEKGNKPRLVTGGATRKPAAQFLGGHDSYCDWWYLRELSDRVAAAPSGQRAGRSIRGRT